MPDIYYKSLDEIPLYNWTKCMNGEHRFIRIDLKESNNNEKQFVELYNLYLNTRGFNKDYIKYISIIKKKAMLQCDYLITKDAFKLTQIEIEDMKLENMQKMQAEPVSVEKTLIYLSKWLGYRLDWKQVTASEYYLILEEYGKANK